MGKLAAKRKQNIWNKFRQTEFAKWPDRGIWNRVYATTTLVLFVISTLAITVQPFIEDQFYGVTPATRSVIPQAKDSLATYMKYDAKEAKFLYNSGYTGGTNSELNKTGQGEPRISATFAKEPSKGVTVTDALNKIDFKVTPKFKLNVGKQDKNQIFYPLVKTGGFLVYTAQTASVKEDIVLERAGEDRLSFEYNLDLGDGLEARLEKNGSIGVYGSSLPISGNVATGSEKDAELLNKARTNANKDKLMFVIPAPTVVEPNKQSSSVSTHYELDGKKLVIVAEGLKKASYPLSIDPSVYVQSAAQLMKGNNETNVEFDVATEQFKKGTTTGARIDNWTDTTNMSSSVWDQGMAAAGGYVYRAGGMTSSLKPEIIDSITTTQSTASATFTMNMPATRPAGDLYVAIFCHDVAGTAVLTPPTGGNWTEYADLGEHGAYYKIGEDKGGGNEAANYAWTKSGTTGQWAGVILRIRNFNPTTIPNVTPTTGSATGVPTYPAITATSSNTLLLRAAGVNNDLVESSGYSPANHTDVSSVHSSGTASGSACGFMSSELTNPPLSGSSTTAAALSTAASDSYGASSLAINGVTVSNTMNSTVEWAHFNSADGTIDSPAPGSNGTACSGWCTNSAYNLPDGAPSTSATAGAGRVGMAMVAYNGYLYVMGGYDGTYLKSTVYVAKLGANGEPSLWHPSDPVQANWTYWYKDSGLNAAAPRAYLSAYAYNGKMYVLGGDTDTTANSGATNSVQIASILPNGTLGSWSSSTNLPSNTYGAAAQAYNGYLYIIGGSNNGTMNANVSTGVVYYTKINSDGTLNSWNHAAADGAGLGFATPRESHGGLMSGIWGGYLYLAGGCTSVNASGYCLTTASDVQLASINADGTLDNWNTMIGLKNKRFGHSFIAWQDSLYRFGGCGYQDASTGECYDTHKIAQYGNINQDGDASTVSVTTAEGTGLCQGDDPYDCNLPPPGSGAGQGGQMLTASTVLNGFLYVVGGCTNVGCTAVTANISYTAIDSNGKLKRPNTCQYSTYGAWCVDDTTATGSGLAAVGLTVFKSNIYVIGGLTGSALSSNVYKLQVNPDGSFGSAWGAQSFASVNLDTYFASGLAYTFTYARANPASAGSVPGHLFIFGGCNASGGGAGCNGSANDYDVVRCNIQTNGDIASESCTNSGQLAITQLSIASGQGLGMHAGAVYANYIYLIGGVAPGALDVKKVTYAKFDNNNNVVAASGSTWTESSVEMNTGRRRGTAFGYNGYLYAVGGYEETLGSPLDTIEFVKINVSDGSLISTNYNTLLEIYQFEQSAVTISQRWGLGLAVSNSYAYVIGGCAAGPSPSGCTAFDPTVQTFQVYNNDSGAPGGYNVENNLYTTDTKRIGASAAVYNGYMYIAGGCISATDCTNASSSVMYAPIDAYGVLGTWNITASLPADRAWGQLEVAGGYLYYLGGQSDTAGDERSEVYYGQPSSGSISSWTSATMGIGNSGSGAQSRTKFSSTVWNNRIYVVGGLNDLATVTNTVYYSPQLNSGGDITGNWGSTTAMNVSRGSHTTIAYANNLYVFGGYDGTNYLSDVQFNKINSDGTVGSTWTYTTSLPTPIAQADGFAVNGYMYLFGGRSSKNDCTPRTMIAPISANTVIISDGSGNNPTGIGEWYQTNRNFSSGRFGAAAVYSQGKAYVLGGGCEGIVMQDDFDDASAPYYDGSQWTSIANMTASTNCQSNSTTKTLSGTEGGTGGTAAIATTINVNVPSGGTVYFRLYMPIADIGTCYRGESTGFLTPTLDNVRLEYSNSGGAWTLMATGQYNQLDPMKNFAIAIPAGAYSATTKFRWIMTNGEATDSFAIEDVSIIATGDNTISYADTSSVVKTSLLSQPQVASYSRLVDAGHDVFPTKWLLNGLDNSIGARWQMSYRSMNDSTVTDTTKACGGSVMTGFGALTQFGDVTLASPEAYTVKNSGGTDIKCSRYFFMNVYIDASQTYGYPDDISRGPTLDNLTLFFQSNPGQRLIHGKTFIEGTQQPLDTQPGP
jgi:hypothetical protein